MIQAGWEPGTGDVKALRALADAILPGDGNRWPPASGAIEDFSRLVREFPQGDLPWVLDLARRLATMLPPARAAAAAASEAEEPERFARAVQALYRVYYTSAPVLAVVEAAADAGPREPSPVFDNSLLAQVLATRAGHRRL